MGERLVNSQRDPIRVRNESHRVIRIKGLSIPLDSNMASAAPVTTRSRSVTMRSRSVTETYGWKSSKTKPIKKVITAARIEFSSEVEKNLFLLKLRDVQGYPFPGLV